MTQEEWIKKFTQNWIDVIDCDIDFSKHEPISVGNSLHIHKKEYSINGITYRVLYPINSETPLIQKLDNGTD